MSKLSSCLMASAMFAAACSDDSPATGGQGQGGQGGDGGGGGPAVNLDFVAGGDRPVNVRVPPGYDEGEPAPLIILLHGYGASGGLQDVYLEMSGASLERGVVFAAPDGTLDSLDRRFWNATDACCNFDDIEVDDDAYLMGLVDEIQGKLAIDPKRIFFAGHSNGAFMSHRLACDHADQIAAILSLAGALALDTSLCQPSEPVSVLQIHGTADDTIHYEGGTNIGNEYPGVEVTIGTWVDRDGCSEESEGDALDLDIMIEGNETSVTRHEGCDGDKVVELWSIAGGGHIPPFGDSIGGVLVDWLLAHPKQ